jgi:putative ABC transport system ATP-binding protein
MEAAGITLEGVTKLYETLGGVVHAVEDVHLEIEPGQTIAITGPSGCGKSTLLGLIAGLESPTSGTVTVGGHEMSSLPEAERASLRRESIGLVFQADNLLPFMTATENVAAQLALRGARDGYARCAELLAELGLGDEAGKLPDQLSGGQRQRVAVARALVHSPRIVLADEPTGALDVDNSQAVMDMLLAARDRTGATLVVVTHDPSVAARLDTSLRLRDGRLVDGAAGGDAPARSRTRA